MGREKIGEFFIEAKLDKDDLILSLGQLRRELKQTERETKSFGRSFGKALGGAAGFGVAAVGAGVGIAKIAGPQTQVAFEKFGAALELLSLALDKIFGGVLNQLADSSLDVARKNAFGGGLGVSPDPEDLAVNTVTGDGGGKLRPSVGNIHNTDYIGRNLNDFGNPLEKGGSLQDWVNWVKRNRAGGEDLKIDKVEVRSDGMGNGPWGTFG